MDLRDERGELYNNADIDGDLMYFTETLAKRGYNDKELIVFVHIPKAAGTSVRRMLYQGLEYEDENDFVPDINDRDEVIFFGAHCYFGLHEKLFPNRKYKIFTFLRDPIETIVSYYYYARRMENHDFHEFCIEHDIIDFLKNEDPFYQMRTHNMHTRFLSGGDPYDLRTAKDNLKKIQVVGIVERMEESMKLMDKVFNIPDFGIVTSNDTKDRPSIDEIPEEAIELIKEYNKLDFELYEYANKILDKQLSSKFGFFASLKKFK